MAIAIRDQITSTSFDGGGQSAVIPQTKTAAPALGSLGMTTKATNNNVAKQAVTKAFSLTEIEGGDKVASATVKSYQDPVQNYNQARLQKNSTTIKNPVYYPTKTQVVPGVTTNGRSTTNQRNYSTSRGTVSEINPSAISNNNRSGLQDQSSNKLSKYLQSEEVKSVPTSNVVSEIINRVTDGVKLPEAVMDVLDELPTVTKPQIIRPTNNIVSSGQSGGNVPNKLQNSVSSSSGSNGNVYNLYGGGQRKKKKRRKLYV